MFKDLFETLFLDKGMRWVTWGVIVVTLIMCICAWTTEKECEAKGGKMKGTGKHSTIVMSAGDGVYTTMEVENTKCNKE